MRVKADDTIAGDGYFAGRGHIDGGLLRRLAARIAAFGDREELWSKTCRSPERCSAQSPGVPGRT
jgi:hypothetical protein